MLSTESVYEFTVGKNEIIFSAYFTSGHVVTYTDITEDNHTESCKHCDYTSTVSYSFVYEEIVDEATCRHEGEKELSCACGKTKIVDGKAYLVSKEIRISQRFAESDEGELTYENSWIRNWLINTLINEKYSLSQEKLFYRFPSARPEIRYGARSRRPVL